MFRVMFQGRGIRRAVALAGAMMLCLVSWSPGTLQAQSDLGKISGFVKDPSGATVPNAKVTVRNNAGSVERQRSLLADADLYLDTQASLLIKSKD